jgi:hypothetical protein
VEGSHVFRRIGEKGIGVCSLKYTREVGGIGEVGGGGTGSGSGGIEIIAVGRVWCGALDVKY